jgi:hypothetical protein
MDQPEKNENISLDDISFDDMLDGGVEAATEESPPEPKEEVATDDELDADADNLKVEDKEDIIEEESEEPEEQEEEEVDEEVDEEESEGEQTVVSEIMSKLGYESDGEYDDTTEGLIQLTQDMGQQMAEDQMEELFEKFPLVKNHLQYVLNGGDSQDFMQAYDPNLDYNQVEITEDDTRSQKAILSDYFATKGHDQNFINELLEDYEDTGKLYQKAESAKKALAGLQAQERQTLVQQQKEQREQTIKQQEEFWGNVQETIQNSDEFAGLSITQRDKGKFFDYISRPVTKDGYTQRDLDHNEAEMDVRLAIDYLMYKGFNLNDIVDKKARTKSARSLRDKISRNEESIKSARKAGRRKKSFDVDDLDLSI